MTYLEKKNIDEAIHQKLRNNYVYKSYMHKIYNLVMGQTNDQLKEKAASDATFQAVKTDQPNRLPDDPEEDMHLKSIRTTPNLFIVPASV